MISWRVARTGLLALLTSWTMASSPPGRSQPPPAPPAPPAIVPVSPPAAADVPVAPLTRAVIGLQERLRTGTAKNGVRVATVSSSSPVAVAVLRLQPGPGVQVRAAVPLLADVAARSLGSSGRVEVDVEVDVDSDVDGRGDGAIAIVMVAPASNPDGPVRAADAVLKALRAKVPAVTAWPTPAVFDAGLDGDSDDLVVPVLPVLEAAAPVASATAPDVQGALLALAAFTPAQVSLAVVGPGRPDDLVKKAASLLSAPLAKVPATPTPTPGPTPATPTPGTPTTTTAPTAPTATPTTVTAVLVPRPAAALDRVALRVVSTLLAGKVVRMGDAMGLVPGATGRSSVEGVSSVPPPEEVVADAAAREQRRQLAGLDDVARVAARAARDLLAGEAPFAELQAAAVVSPDDVSRLARSLLSGTRSVITVPPPAKAPSPPSKSTAGSVVDVVDGLPWAVAVVPGVGPWSVAGPCGPRRAVGLPATAVSGPLEPAVMAAEGSPRPLPQPSGSGAASATAATSGSVWLPLAFGPGVFEGEGEVLALAVDAALLKAKVPVVRAASLRLVGRRAFVEVATAETPAVVAEALQRFVPDQKNLGAWTAAADVQRVLQERRLGLRALHRVDQQLCFPLPPAPLPPLSTATVRAALAAPLLTTEPVDGPKR